MCHLSSRNATPSSSAATPSSRNATLTSKPATMPSVHASGGFATPSSKNAEPTSKQAVPMATWSRSARLRRVDHMSITPASQRYARDKIITARGHPVTDPHTATAR